MHIFKKWWKFKANTWGGKSLYPEKETDRMEEPGAGGGSENLLNVPTFCVITQGWIFKKQSLKAKSKTKPKNLAGYRIGSITTQKGIIWSESEQSFHHLFPRVIPWGQKEFQKKSLQWFSVIELLIIILAVIFWNYISIKMKWIHNYFNVTRNQVCQCEEKERQSWEIK